MDDPKILLVAETGSDIPPEIADSFDIHIVPMRVTFGSTSRDDGTFPAEEICSYYERTGELPRTSSCNYTSYTIKETTKYGSN